jgi:hypothetical protein
VTGQVYRGEAVRGQVEVREWADLGEEEWAAPEQVQVLEENACVRNAERPLLMKQERRATSKNAPNAVHRW